MCAVSGVGAVETYLVAWPALESIALTLICAYLLPTSLPP